jgi:hypothetical protein
VGESDAQKSFERLMSLAGAWQGKTQEGRPVKVSYRVTSNGSALLSEIAEPEGMITMFHLDGGRLLMTHYCVAGNPPRMQAAASRDGKTITFNFVDATNLATPDTGHMQRLVLSLVDAHHHVEAWCFLANGKEVTERFDLYREPLQN